MEDLLAIRNFYTRKEELDQSETVSEKSFSSIRNRLSNSQSQQYT